jgi:hypothetical protein
MTRNPRYRCVDLSIDESFPMIDSHMEETAWDETVITTEFIGVNETSAFHFLDGHCKESFNRWHSGQRLPGLFPCVPGYRTRGFSPQLPGPITLSPTKVWLIHFNLSRESEWMIAISPDYWLSEQVEEIVNGVRARTGERLREQTYPPRKSWLRLLLGTRRTLNPSRILPRPGPHSFRQP